MKKILCSIISLVLLLSLCAGALAEEPLSLTLYPITWEDAGIGKVGLPDGYVFTNEVRCYDDTTCLGSPLRLTVVAVSEADRCILGYYANETYIQRVKWSSNITKHVTGEIDKQTQIFMCEYMDANMYSDHLAKSINPDAFLYREEDTSVLNTALAQHEKLFADEILPGLKQYGLTPEWLKITGAHRAYSVQVENEPWILCILTETRGYQYSMNRGKDVCCIWDVPGYYYMLCPESSYMTLHETVFLPFAENTSVSDTFIKLQDQLTEQIQKDTIAGWSRQIAASNAYAAAMNAFTSASVNSYLQQSAYSSVNRFSDYIFDRNTYITSTGSEVSVSTSYDYVWEGSNGTVYYSDSALSVPYGASLLDPR